MSITVAHFSDLHLAAPPESAEAFFDKRLLGLINGNLIRGKYRRERVPLCVQEILRRKPDVAVFTGDAVTCMQPSEFRKAEALLRPIREAGIPLLWSPGNHDKYVKNRKCVEAFRSCYHSLTDRWPEELPFAFDLGEFRFLVFDFALPRNPILSDGICPEETAAFLEKACIPGKRILGISHFSVLGSRNASLRRNLKNAGFLAEMLQKKQMELLLCGHDHTPQRRLDEQGFGESDAGSLTKYGVWDWITAEEKYRFEQQFIR